MPGVSDAVETGPSPREKAEAIKLWLPSHLDMDERDALCSGGVVASEREFRFGQVHDSLDELRKARRIRRGLILFHKVQLVGEGQKTQTQSRAVMHTVQERIDRAVCRYRTSRAALLRLDPSGSWQELYRTLGDRDNRGPGKEPEEVPTSDGQYFPSWIWLTSSNMTAGDTAQTLTISPDEVNEDMRVEWAQCIARADRWEEEVVLLQEEMRRVVCFLDWKSTDWVSKAGVRASVTPEVCSGLSAYAHKQGSVFRNLGIRFCRRWRSTLNALSLPHAWATKFLETQDTPLIDCELDTGNLEHPEHEPSKSSTTLDHTEPPAANTATIPTNPENSNNNPETSSDAHKAGNDDDDEPTDDSIVDSSESEYEPGGW